MSCQLLRPEVERVGKSITHSYLILTHLPCGQSHYGHGLVQHVEQDWGSSSLIFQDFLSALSQETV
jgi:hypothetical protein